MAHRSYNSNSAIVLLLTFFASACTDTDSANNARDAASDDEDLTSEAQTTTTDAPSESTESSESDEVNTTDGVTLATGDTTQGDAATSDTQDDAATSDTAQGDAATSDTAQGDAATSDTAQGDAATGDTQGDAATSDTADLTETTGDSGDTLPNEPADSGDANSASLLPVDLGSAENFVILAKSGISSVPTSVIVGNIGVSPAAATLITGFPLSADQQNVFATTPQVTGKVFAADYALDPPAMLTTAVGDMELAFTDAAGRAPDFTELGAGDIGGLTLSPGVYKWGTGLLIPTDVTLDGSATDVWIFQVAQDLELSNGTNITLTGGALPEHVFWQVAGLVDFGTTSHAERIVLTQTSVALQTGASLNGRVFAQTAVTLDSSTIVEPE
jgi:Ice-binding-like